MATYNPGSGFRFNNGVSESRINPVNGKNEPHRGEDWSAPQGTAIPAAADGKVWFSGNLPGYGNLVVLKHDNVYTLYAHLEKPSALKTGQSVEQGQSVGNVGSTGERSTGPHLHFEVIPKNVSPIKKGHQYIDPRQYDFGSSSIDSDYGYTPQPGDMYLLDGSMFLNYFNRISAAPTNNDFTLIDTGIYQVLGLGNWLYNNGQFYNLSNTDDALIIDNVLSQYWMQGILDSKSYLSFSQTISRTLTQGSSTFNQSYAPADLYNPIGAFYEARSAALDTAASIAGKTPVLMNAAKLGLSANALQALDANRDGRLSGAELNGLQVWVDANEDGIGDAGEFRTLAQAGIQEIRSTDYGFITSGNSKYASGPVAVPIDKAISNPPYSPPKVLSPKCWVVR